VEVAFDIPTRHVSWGGTVSIRYYSGMHAESRGLPRNFMLVPWVLASLTILGQIVWILAVPARDFITIGTVITFAAASFTHAWITRGWLWALSYFSISAGVGFIAEAVGTATSLPFGEYFYADSLGPKVLGVPFVIPLAWAMMAYPVLLAAQKLAGNRIGVTVIGAWLLMSWDLFLDPQMVAEGHWSWPAPDPALPGIPGIPISNYLGWLLIALIMMGLLSRLPQRRANDGVPTLMLAWVFLSNILASAVFFDRPMVAVWGGIAMGAVVIPWAWISWTERP